MVKKDEPNVKSLMKMCDKGMGSHANDVPEMFPSIFYNIDVNWI